jgi:ABC-type transport system involved in multi-copper enzyme maturation permease subunit
MMAALYAEFRKFTTVRSTYVISLLSLLLGSFIAYWGMGYKGGPIFQETAARDAIFFIMSIVGLFIGVAAILLVCHEYRYNTIGYTLASSNNRLKVLAAKLTVTAGYGILMAIITAVAAAGLMMLGAHVHGYHLPAQSLDMFDIAWKIIAYMVGATWFGLTLGFLSRSVVFAIVGYFLLPSIEPLLHALAKISNNYLPMAAHDQIITTQTAAGQYTPLASLGVFGLYILAGIVASTIVFLRRDAN